MERKSIYIGNLPYDTHLSEVQELFNKHGHVHSAKLVCDQSGMPRGYGFVEMRATDAEAAVTFLNGNTFGGRQIKVNISKQSEEMGLRDNGLDRFDRFDGRMDRSSFRARDDFQRRDRISDIDRDRIGARSDRVVRRYDSVSNSNRRDNVTSGRRYEEDSRNLRGSSQQRRTDTGTTSRRYDDNDSRRYEEDTSRRYDETTDNRRVEDRDGNRNSRRTETPSTTKQSSGSRHTTRYQPYPST